MENGTKPSCSGGQGPVFCDCRPCRRERAARYPAQLAAIKRAQDALFDEPARCPGLRGPRTLALPGVEVEAHAGPLTRTRDLAA